MFYLGMSSEQPQAEIALETPEASEDKKSNRVDINHLLARVREEKKKENKVSLLFFSLVALIFFASGLILSF